MHACMRVLLLLVLRAALWTTHCSAVRYLQADLPGRGGEKRRGGR